MISITDFGAVSGAPDNSAAIQSALTSAAGEPVYVPPGVWDAEGLSIPPKSHLCGASDQSSILRRKSGSTTFLAASQGYVQNNTWVDLGCVVHDLQFDGGKPDTIYAAGQDALILRTYRSTVERCRFTNGAGHGLLLTSRSADGTPIANSGMAENRIDNNRMDRNNGAGLYGRDSGANRLADVMIRDNCAHDNGGSLFFNIDFERCPGSNVRGNHVYGTGRGTMRLLQAGALNMAGNNFDATLLTPGSGTQYTCYVEIGGWVLCSIVDNLFHNHRASAQSGVTYVHLGMKRTSGTVQGVIIGGNSLTHQSISGQEFEMVNFPTGSVTYGVNAVN